ncbi:unnamed protein product [Microthlaspi erraticum]|uniref:FAD-binding PCMH-type domain-containing protein n=1 Tax=Microthlaspi erraticum TaxID=1685480 RepID=A0A6D2HIT9_9BRAS|nr:unnamed protein product [Microthlaspi erraticum]
METLVVIYLLLISVSVTTSQSVTDSATLLQCLVREGSNPQNNISTVTYIPTNSSFTAVLRRRIPTSVSTNPQPQNPSPSSPPPWSHIGSALACARDLPIQVRIRSGGHDFEGLSYTSTVPFFIIDMFNFKSVDVNLTEGTAWADTGATIGELYYRIAEKSNVLGFPAGLCTTLGVGGHFSGGGYGNLMRKYGLSVDNVVGSGIVDSNWEYIHRSGFDGGRPFWAVRGGGAASFGIVLGYKIRLVPVPERVNVFSVGKTVGEGAVDLLMKWQSFAHSTDRNLFVKVTLTVVNGTKPAEENRLYRNEMDRFGSVWAGFPIGTPTSVLLNPTVGNKLFMKRKSDYVKSSISRTGLGLMIKKLVEVEKVEMNWNPYGGRMGEIRVRGHRSHIEQAICSTLSMS